MDNLILVGSYIYQLAAWASFIVLGLLIVIFLRDRRTEIGIYLALGEKKWAIIKQLLMELGIVVAFSLAISIFWGVYGFRAFQGG
ncbi:MAG: FtsX-like permease family protein [Turicibacter sp.]|nr:FtsX-like permease family protein [Turicibacter sp.]